MEEVGNGRIDEMEKWEIWSGEWRKCKGGREWWRCCELVEVVPTQIKLWKHGPNSSPAMLYWSEFL